MLSSLSRRLSALRPLSHPITHKSFSTWAGVPMGPPDPILGLTDAFNKDTDPSKVNLGVGAYRGDDGKPYLLPSVLKAEQAVVNSGMNKEYAGIAGIKDFVDRSLEFVYGDSAPLKENRVVGMQVLSGTGGCRLAGEFFSRFLGKGTAMYMPNPTWANHTNIFNDAGMECKSYRYYKAETRGLDFDGLMEDFEAAPNGSVFLLHSCAHNPTGVDPSPAQWDEIAALMLRKKHHAFMDTAYQGFASGDAELDAYSVRKFANSGVSMSVAQSFAKNFGLYGERVGAFSVVAADADEAARVESQLKILIRPMYSNPPIHGARVVARALSDPDLCKEWTAECKGMADRINGMRATLKQELKALGSVHNWDHITNQIGMFCFTGLTAPQVERMISEFHVYMTKNGRISVAGLTTGNVKHVANAMYEVTK